MKQLVCWIVCCCVIVAAKAQNGTLSICMDKTTSLIFPLAIKHVDRGSRNILVQQVPEAENILLVKAGTANFHETNLSVVTSDGSLYSFTICFDTKPSQWIYHLLPQKKFSTETYASGLLDNPPTVKSIKDHKWDMTVSVTGIYSKEDVLFYQLQLVDTSPIDYDIDFIRFFIRDQRQPKRTAIQETELIPIAIAGNNVKVKANSASVLVYALPKFSIPDAKILVIQAGEKNGGRHLQMMLKNKHILKAKKLNWYHEN